jgi:tryptophan-rich sensory protein
VQAIGDTWNYITNSKGEMGVSVAYVSLVWISAAALDYVYFTTSTTAGYVLLPLCFWLTAAAALVYGLWDVNGRASLLPIVEASEAN